jgi:hypothetical protein
MIDGYAQYGFWCHATLAPELSPSGRRTWYRRLERQLQSEGFATGLHRSVVVVLDGISPAASQYRHRLVHALLQDPLLVAIQVGNLVPLLQFEVRGRTGTYAWEAEGLPRGQCNPFIKATLHSIHCGVTRASRSKARRDAQGPMQWCSLSIPPPWREPTVMAALRL